VDTSSEVVDFPEDEEGGKPVIKSEPVKTESTIEPSYVKIAIGVYGNPDNAARVIAKIEKAGFIPFSEKVGSLTKVGVKQEYKSVAEKLEILEKVRSDIESIRIELQKDRQYMESRITQLEQQVHKIRNQLTSILLTLAKSKIPVDSTDLDDK
jgi:hypothetical protein